MSNFTRRLLSKVTITPPSSSSSVGSQKSYHETIDKTQIENTLNFVLRMQQSVKQMKKPKKSSVPKMPIKIRIPLIERLQSTQTSRSAKSEKLTPLMRMLCFCLKLAKVRNASVRDQHTPVVSKEGDTLGSILQGRKVYLNFTENETAKIYDEQGFQDYQDWLGMQQQIETHQTSKLKKYRQLLTKSERSILTQKLERIMWTINSSQASETTADNNQPFDPYGLIREQRRQDFYVPKVEEVKPSSAAVQIQQEQMNRLARIKEKADDYIVKKFKHTGIMVQTLSKSMKLKPLKTIPCEEVEQQYTDLHRKQVRLMKKVKPILGRQNRAYLKHDMQQIEYYVQTN